MSPPRGSEPPRRPAGEEAFVAGSEALVFGVLVFVFGTLIVLNAWAVVDTKFATNAAAREAVRAVVETDIAAGFGPGQLSHTARQAAADAFAAHGGDPARLTVEVLQLTTDRCAPVRIRAEADVTSTVVPGIAGPRLYTVGSEHEEVIDPFRAGLAGEAGCGF